ncbi:MAG: DUF3795 domain-containing protein [Butyrivibrio sp.]|nr:DUF3795 domain-containing protein [Butyrivibrio sp.]
MKSEFNRKDGLFSLCGLNCGLCPMQIRGGCSGCFNGSTCYISCPLAPCSVRHGNVDYCYQCNEYPCKKYDGIDAHDSLISHRNQKKDLAKAKEIGIEAYLEEQHKKKKILNHLLEDYDDGSKDVFFCLAVNMMEVDDLSTIIQDADQKTTDFPIIEKTHYIEKQLRDCAERKNIPLVLRKW